MALLSPPSTPPKTQVNVSLAVLLCAADCVPSPGVWAPDWTPHVVDLNGDGLSDVFLYNATNGVWYRCLSTGDGTRGFAHVLGQWAAGWRVYPADFDADGRSDLLLYNGSAWQKVVNAGSAFDYFVGGWAHWTIAFTDLNGDGRSDGFLLDAPTGVWYQAVTTSPGAFGYTHGEFH